MIDKTALKAEAFRLGFWLCGVTTPDPPPHLDTYHAWINAGRHADMAYLASPRALTARASPASLLPGCQTILALAAPYPAPLSHPSKDNGRIAAYAQSSDYHNVFPPRLEALAAWIARQAGQPIQWRSFTDTAPILEKELAQRAGLGWIGKNTNLINPQIGSYFLLAELFLDRVIEPDPPFTADRCGTCTRCIEACPTGCILSDRTLDAARCLSYLTIENKGPIPPDLRPQIGTRIFGCDLCQQVCPWNQKASIQPEQTLFPPLESLAPRRLAAEMQLDDAAFRERFRHTPLLRAKRRGYLRNVAVALGNLAQPKTVPALAASLRRDPEPLIRAHAAWALGQIPQPEARTALQSALQSEPDPVVQSEIQQALNNFS
ncbi:MAG: tRNA epoxyqueuosine(34) reductase QueG [Anaerolineaceae bacterium]|jgi:epoxyqueuosine reductase|nr:tRNA epoxyqueuosine(34) reductase QueG [Anaerolineaceae bacterium]